MPSIVSLELLSRLLTVCLAGCHCLEDGVGAGAKTIDAYQNYAYKYSHKPLTLCGRKWITTLMLKINTG